MNYQGPKANYYDLQYDDMAQDLATSGGDLAPYVTAHSDHFSQLLKDALESRFASMKHVMRGWGFEGRGDDYTTKDNTPKQKAYMYLAEILSPLSFLLLNVRAVSPTFTATGFDMRVEAVLCDLRKTEYDHVLSWNQNTIRASIT